MDMLARHLHPDSQNEPVPEGKIGQGRKLLSEERFNYLILEKDLHDLRKLLEILNDANKSALEASIMSDIGEINLRIKVLSRYNKDLEMKALGPIPSKSHIDNYISYTVAMIKEINTQLSGKS